MEHSKVSTCISLLTSAKSDNEKLAALLLVPKLLNVKAVTSVSDTSGNESQDDDAGSPASLSAKSAIYKAIGFQFLKRILVSGQSTTEDKSLLLTDEQLSLKAAGLSVIRCFTDCDVFTDDEVKELISALESILLIDSPVTEMLDEIKLKEDKEQEYDSEWQSTYGQVTCMATEVLEELSKSVTTDILDANLMPCLYKIAMKQSKLGE